MNFKIQSVRSIAQINPTTAGDVLNGLQMQRNYNRRNYFDHNIDGTCYIFTPVRSGKTFYFIQPARQDFIFNAPPIFHSDLAKISTDIYLIKNHLDSIDNTFATQTKTSTRNLESISEQLDSEITNSAGFLESNAAHFLQSQKKGILQSLGMHKLVRTLVITSFCLLVLIVIIVLYFQSSLIRILFNIIFRMLANAALFIVNNTCRRKSPPKEDTSEESPPNNGANERPRAAVRRTRRTNEPHTTLNIPAFSDISLHTVPPFRPIPEPSRTRQFLNFLPNVSCIHNANSSPLMYISTNLNNSHVVALLDTGSAITLISETVARKINAHLLRSTNTTGITANGTPMHLLGQFTPNLTIGDKTIRILCYVAPDAQCSSSFIIGNDVLPQLACKLSIDYQASTISLDEMSIPFVTTGVNNYNYLQLPVHLIEDTTFPPFSDTAVVGTTNTSFPKDWELFTSDDHKTLPLGVQIGKTLSCPNTQGRVILRIFNAGSNSITLRKNINMATATFVGANMQWKPIFS
ncbi:hypothetical protein OSTOST_14416 [Ostertagia ostertagi]